MVLNLAKKAYEIFQCSEVEEKRQLLNFLLQNATLEGKKLNFELKNPFDVILEASKCPTWLVCWDDFKNLKWVESIQCPELIMKWMKELLVSV